MNNNIISAICLIWALAASGLCFYLYDCLLKKRKKLNIQSSRLQAFADIYNTMHIINLKENTVCEFKSTKEIQDLGDTKGKADELMEKVIRGATSPEYLEKALAFTDLATLSERMKNVQTLSGEFHGINLWYRGRFIVVDRDDNGSPINVIWATVIVQEEKKREEGLIQISMTDELTGLSNRRAMEEAIERYNQEQNENITIVSLDLNGLKRVNDTLGHAKGDAIIVAASCCMKKAFSEYGEVYRTGGDEFLAILKTSADELDQVFRAFETEIETYKEAFLNGVSVSYGYVNREEFPGKTIGQLMVLADERMYEMKKNYYEHFGIDRRKR